MRYRAQTIIHIYLILTLLNTLAASFIWGINTLFLLDGGLNNTEAFAANAFFTAGQVLFEVPTGMVADTKGRRFSFLLGSVTLTLSTLFYLFMWQIHGPFWGWALTSILLGLGFTFFSGATEAWLVDALKATKFKGDLETVFGKGQIVIGIGMLTGSLAGGIIAQYTNLAVPYLLRAAMLVLSFIAALVLMHDVGFHPMTSRSAANEMKRIFSLSIRYGLKNPPVRFLMLAAPFTGGVSIYAFYAMQPYLLELYGNTDAYSIAGVAAAIVAGAQIVGGLSVPLFKKIFKTRTTFILVGILIDTVILFAMGYATHFITLILLIIPWALIFAATIPIRQTFINGLIPSKQRATVLSFDSLMNSAGGVIFQPVLGKVADIWGYASAYIVCAVITLMALPFILLAKLQRKKADIIR